MSLGMIGAIGGLGEGISTLGGAMMQDVQEERRDQRQRDYQGWLMAKQDEFAVAREGRAEQTAVRSEGRAEQRTIATENRGEERGYRVDDRTFAKKVERAPTERGIKVEDQTAEAAGKLNFETTNRDAISANTKAGAEAKQTDATKKKLEADANKDDATAEYYRGAKTEFARGAGGKVDAATLEGIKSLNDRVEKAEARWNDGVLNGTIVKGKDGKLGTPEQRSIYQGIIEMRQQAIDAMKQARPGMGAGAAPDPFNRGAAAPGATGKDKGGNPVLVAGSDLDNHIAGLERTLADAKPDSELFARTQRDIAVARAERAKMPAGGAPAAQPTGMVMGPPASAAPGVAPVAPAAPTAPVAPAAPATVNLNNVPAAKPVQDVVRTLREQLAQQAAPATPARDPLLDVLNPGGNSSMDSVMGPKAAQLRPLYDAAQAAQAEVAQIAKTTPGAVGQAIAKANAARSRLRQAVENMGRSENMDPAQLQSMVARLTAP